MTRIAGRPLPRVHLGENLSLPVPHDKANRHFLDRPGCGETAGSGWHGRIIAHAAGGKRTVPVRVSALASTGAAAAPGRRWEENQARNSTTRPFGRRSVRRPSVWSGMTTPARRNSAGVSAVGFGIGDHNDRERTVQEATQKSDIRSFWGCAYCQHCHNGGLRSEPVESGGVVLGAAGFGSVAWYCAAAFADIQSIESKHRAAAVRGSSALSDAELRSWRCRWVVVRRKIGS